MARCGGAGVAHAQAPVTLATLAVGQTVVGYVHDIQDSCLFVNLSPSLSGRVPALHVWVS